MAETLIQRSPEIAETQPELIAHHLAEAGEAKAAIDWWERAGQRALQRPAAVEAARHVGRALDALATMVADPARNERELGLRTLHGVALMAAEGYGSEAVQDTFRRAYELCRATGETPLLFPTLFGLWAIHFVRADRDETLEHLDQLIRVAEATQDEMHRMVASMSHAMTSFYSGRHEKAMASAETVLSLYDPERHAALAYLFGQDIGVYGYVAAAMSLWHLGYPDRAAERIEQAATLAERVRHPHSLCGALSYAATLRVHRREILLVEGFGRRLGELADEQSFPMWRGVATLYCDHCARLRGEDHPDIYERGFAVYEATGARINLVQFLSSAVDAELRQGRADAGLAWVARAKRRLEVALDVEFAAEVARLEGELLHLRDGPTAAVEACFERALATAREQKSRSLELRAATSLARLRREEGKPGEARALLAPVYGWFTEGFDTRDLMDAKTLLEELGG